MHYLTLLYWLVHTLMTYGHLPIYLSVPILFLLVAYMALYPAIFAAVFSWADTKPVGFLSAMPAIWVALEYLRSFFLSGFPWEFLGYSQYRQITLIQAADMTGVYGISFVILSVNVAGFLTLAASFGKAVRKRHAKSPFCCLRHGRFHPSW